MTGMQGRDTFLRKEDIGPGGRNLTTRLYIVENTPVMRVSDTLLRKGSVSPVGIDWKEGLVWGVTTDMRGRDMFLRKGGMEPEGRDLKTGL
ncbi:hypothetical protein ElyMa_005254000 [Elysia marginata]|uniref:Uncharacterized protein n=1 Tax=Elysia marginata TaxID=1093978 RepID=A0AAV4JXX9_9GAST|nr:hypothetical protein ElyMa_005254000 [Elysia marginata]